MDMIKAKEEHDTMRRLARELFESATRLAEISEPDRGLERIRSTISSLSGLIAAPVLWATPANSILSRGATASAKWTLDNMSRLEALEKEQLVEN